MTINEYQTEALRTAAGMNHPNNDEILLNGVMGLCGESGECVDMVKKYRFQGHELDKAHLAKELGDVAWYLAVTACIRYHMGAFCDKSEWNDYTRAVHKYTNVLWAHQADMLASHVEGV